MSTLIRQPFFLARPSQTLRLVRPSIPTSTSQFHSSARFAAGKESALHNEGRAEEAEQEKQEVLQQAKQHGKGEWRDGLASDSESAIKADRGETHHSSQSISDLQRETAEKAQQEKKK